jgi:hypothetical protein
MGDRYVEDAQLERASKDLARAIWATILLARDEYKARGLLGRATRKSLVEAIVTLMRLVRDRES